MLILIQILTLEDKTGKITATSNSNKQLKIINNQTYLISGKIQEYNHTLQIAIDKIEIKKYRNSKESVLPLRPIDLNFNCNNISLQTSVNRFESNSLINNNNSTIIIDLFSMLHVADVNYYNKINSKIYNYDIVLYELITNKQNPYHQSHLFPSIHLNHLSNLKPDILKIVSWLLKQK